MGDNGDFEIVLPTSLQESKTEQDRKKFHVIRPSRSLYVNTIQSCQARSHPEQESKNIPQSSSSRADKETKQDDFSSGGEKMCGWGWWILKFIYKFVENSETIKNQQKENASAFTANQMGPQNKDNTLPEAGIAILNESGPEIYALEYINSDDFVSSQEDTSSFSFSHARPPFKSMNLYEKIQGIRKLIDGYSLPRGATLMEIRDEGVDGTLDSKVPHENLLNNVTFHRAENNLSDYENKELQSYLFDDND